MEDRDKTREQLIEELAALRKEAERARLYIDLMGHDINNMNQIAIGYLELAMESMAPDAGERLMLGRPLEMLKSSSMLIDNVRKLHAVEDHVFKTEPVDMGRVLEDIKARYEHMPGRDVSIRYKGGSYAVMANRLLPDVFSNLVWNSIKHSSGPVEIDITVVRDHDCYMVAVEDNGPGVPDAIKDRVFDRSWRGPTRASGVGLGLYLVRALVAEYNGKVWIEDRVAGDHTKGSRFVISVPAAKNPVDMPNKYLYYIHG